MVPADDPDPKPSHKLALTLQHHEALAPGVTSANDPPAPINLIRINLMQILLIQILPAKRVRAILKKTQLQSRPQALLKNKVRIIAWL